MRGGTIGMRVRRDNVSAQRTRTFARSPRLVFALSESPNRISCGLVVPRSPVCAALLEIHI